MLFSIIIPVYNVQNYLKQCIDSVLHQVNKASSGCEIILVDDGSTDNSGTICDEYVADHPDLIKVIHKKNQGLLFARRSGLEIASGDYIINLDSDDMFADNALVSIESCINKYNADVVFFNINILNSERLTHYFENVFTCDETCEVEKENVIKSYFIDSVPVVTSMASKAVKKELFNLKQDYSSFLGLSMGEDTLQSAEVFEKAESFVYLNKALYIYRTGTGMTASFNSNYYGIFSNIINYVDSYSYLHDYEKYSEWMNAKLLNTFGRAITQLTAKKDITYNYIYEYVDNLLMNRTLIRALETKEFLKCYISNKYYFIIVLAEKRMIHTLSLMLRIKTMNKR